MAYTSGEKFVSKVASTDMRSHQFKIVDLTTTFGKIDLAAARKAYGVLANKPNAGEDAQVVTEGETLVQVGAAVAVGDWVTAAATGFAAATTSSVDQQILGRVVSAAASGMYATVDVDVFRVGPIA
jgi:hypothetical protein